SIDRLYISRAAQGGNPYDSDAPPTVVHDIELAPAPIPPLLVPMGQTITVSVDYEVIKDIDQALLIAVDFSAAPPSSGIGYVDNVPPEEATGYWHLGHEAKEMNRASNYQPEARIYLVEKIEVGQS